MRADRLMALLMLLQARGRMTARQLAHELEVSERTIYRDIDALSTAGVPVYSESGHNGGFALVDRYRTDLTGLTDGEVRALFMLTIPSPFTDLGSSQDLRSALLKLSASLPDVRRQDEERVRQRIHIDPTRWQPHGEQVPHLKMIHQAVWHDRRLRVAIRTIAGTQIEQTVNPYGLVAKAGIWYLVYARRDVERVVRVSNLLDAQLLEETFAHPADFDLPTFWADWCAEYQGYLSDFHVTIRVAPQFIAVLPHYFGHMIRHKIDRSGQPDQEGWIQLELAFESFEAARDRLLSFGRGVEIVRPEALRRSVLDYAEQIVNLYRGEGSNSLKFQVKSTKKADSF